MRPLEFDVAQWVTDFGERSGRSERSERSPLPPPLSRLWYIWSPTHPNPQSTFSTPPPTHLRPYLGNIKKPRLMAIEHLRRLPRASLCISMLSTDAAWKQDNRDRES